MSNFWHYSKHQTKYVIVNVILIWSQNWYLMYSPSLTCTTTYYSEACIYTAAIQYKDSMIQQLTKSVLRRTDAETTITANRMTHLYIN